MTCRMFHIAAKPCDGVRCSLLPQTHTHAHARTVVHRGNMKWSAERQKMQVHRGCKSLAQFV